MIGWPVLSPSTAGEVWSRRRRTSRSWPSWYGLAPRIVFWTVVVAGRVGLQAAAQVARERDVAQRQRARLVDDPAGDRARLAVVGHRRVGHRHLAAADVHARRRASRLRRAGSSRSTVTVPPRVNRPAPNVAPLPTKSRVGDAERAAGVEIAPPIGRAVGVEAHALDGDVAAVVVERAAAVEVDRAAARCSSVLVRVVAAVLEGQVAQRHVAAGDLHDPVGLERARLLRPSMHGHGRARRRGSSAACPPAASRPA